MVRVRADEPAETIELWPFLHDGKYKETVFAEDSAFSAKEPDGMYKATLGSGLNAKDCSVTRRLQAPSDILDASYVVMATAPRARPVGLAAAFPGWGALRRDSSSPG